MTTTQYWIGKVAVVDWALTHLDGTPVNDATVVGTVTLPDGTTTSMTVDNPASLGDPYRVHYDPTTAGLHAYRVSASGTVDDAEEGTFVVLASLTGAPPITLDPTTTTGRIRLLISDTDPVAPTFTDAEIGAFYAMSGSNVRLGAATALDAIAGNELLVAKVLKTLDLETSGDKVSAELRNLAKSLRDQAGDYDADGNLFGMDIVDFRPEHWWHDAAELAEPTVC